MEHSEEVAFSAEIETISMMVGETLHDRARSLTANTEYNDKLLSAIRALCCRHAFSMSLSDAFEKGVSYDVANLMVRDLQDYIDKYKDTLEAM